VKLERLLQNLQKDLTKVKKGISVMEEHIPDAMTGDYVLPIEQLAEAIQKHKDKQNNLQNEINRVKDELNSLDTTRDNIEGLKNNIPQWKDIFMGTDHHKQRVLVDKLVEKIIVKTGEIHIVYKIKV
jgi:predicted  nucleic acid-binding Zn-ribbon protein